MTYDRPSAVWADSGESSETIEAIVKEVRRYLRGMVVVGVTTVAIAFALLYIDVIWIR